MILRLVCYTPARSTVAPPRPPSTRHRPLTSAGTSTVRPAGSTIAGNDPSSLRSSAAPAMHMSTMQASPGSL